MIMIMINIDIFLQLFVDFLMVFFSHIFAVFRGFPQGTTEDPWKAPRDAAERRGQSAEIHEKQSKSAGSIWKK